MERTESPHASAMYLRSWMEPWSPFVMGSQRRPESPCAIESEMGLEILDVMDSGEQSQTQPSETGPEKTHWTI